MDNVTSRSIRVFRGLVLILSLVTGWTQAGENATPPSISYPNSRKSTENIALPSGLNVGIDKFVEWRGVKVYLSLTHDLVGVDEQTGKVRWHNDVSAFWNRVGFKEIEREPGKKTWAVELRPGDEQNKLAEYYDLKTGAKLDVPGLSRPTGVAFKPRDVPGSGSAVAKPWTALVSTQENYAALCKRSFGESDLRIDFFDHRAPYASSGLLGKEAEGTKVDFSKEVVLLVSQGDSINTFSVYCEEAYEDDARVLVRVHQSGCQTAGRFGGGFNSRPYGLFILPRREGKAYVIEDNDQRYTGGPPWWTEIFRAEKIGDPAKELAHMPPAIPAGMKPELKLPQGFVRKIEKYKTPPPEKDRRELWSSDNVEYEYYVRPDGKQVLHGTYTDLDGWSGTYEDGVPLGIWKQWHGYEMHDTRDKPPALEFSMTVKYCQLHGPAEEYDKDGKPLFKGNYEKGKPQGVWQYFHSGMKESILREESVYDHGLWNGPLKRYSQTGKLQESMNYVQGQLDGPYVRYHENGQAAETGSFVAGEFPPDDEHFDRYMLGTKQHRGYQNGEWICRDSAGHELWRGTFDHGCGDFAEFHANGKKSCEGRLTKGLRRGEFKEWDTDGKLKRICQIAPDGSYSQDFFYDNGAKRFEQHFAKGMMDGPQLYHASDGRVSKGEWRDGQPWSGDIVSGSDGSIARYEDGKRTKEPIRYTPEAREKIDKEEKQKRNASGAASR